MPEPNVIDIETRPEWIESFAAEGIEALELLLSRYAGFEAYLEGAE